MTERPLLQAEGLVVSFAGRAKLFSPPDVVRAVDGVDLKISKGRTLGLVGESGCGKSTTGYALLRLNKATGKILLDGTDIMSLSPHHLRQMRRRVQIIFQDAAASLDPRMTIGDLISEALDLHDLHAGEHRGPRVRELLELVGMPQRFAERYPHELSGGQAQRIAICRALAVEPELIICDEAVSALDVSIQAQILNLLQDLQERLGLSFLFISHDLSVVRHISHDVAVMYLGKIVEQAPTNTLFNDPRHPYTKALMSAVPVPDPDIERARERIVLVGDLPNPANPPTGCRFRTRCPVAEAQCADISPTLREVGTGHSAACLFA
ncbi:ABC transporter ATP-binding protein [Mesorhizobium sp. 1B3]|uniref:ABC transporter ATP-binding protein n=1 Tax=Mesorhizobium sp. 1B3 TaxID=3243599 RepID=UPI003D95FADE